jgi:prepilin-type N-terminal cleavage/methylation domain-containing protein
MQMNHPVQQSSRVGFTLVEMLIAMVIFLVVVGGATRVFISDSRSVAGSAGRLDALQNARFAVNAVDRELRMIGVGVVDAQPMLVQAERFGITFNADLVTKSTVDVAAVYFDPDAPSAAVLSLSKTSPITLPISGASYPDTTYRQGAAAAAPLSTAETISYWVAPDASTPEPDDYVMNRRVNGQTVEVVAKNLILSGSDPVFRYYKLDSLDRLVEIPGATLPLRHTAKVHGSTADTAKSALSDSVVLVKIRLHGRYVDRAGAPQVRTIESNVRLMNAGLIRHSTCGETPLFGRVVNATVNAVGAASVTLTWLAAIDEIGGEKDVERYAIYRRHPLAFDFGEPLASVAAGEAAYSFTDTQVAAGESWVYGVAAQDCTPANSPTSSTVTVVIPATAP